MESSASPERRSLIRSRAFAAGLRFLVEVMVRDLPIPQHRCLTHDVGMVIQGINMVVVVTYGNQRVVVVQVRARALSCVPLWAEFLRGLMAR